MIRRMLFFCLTALAAAGAVSSALAQPPTSVSKASVVTEIAIIEAIDSTNRLVTLKLEDGTMDTIYAGPEVQRFSELKVGDKVTFKYYESVVYAIQQPGDTPPDPSSSSVVRSLGPRPAGAIGAQQTTVVTLKAIDLNVPSVTVTTEDGRTLSLKIEDRSNLTGVKVGDKVQITYTQALAISVESPKK